MPEFFEIEVSLLGIEPRIWRRFLVRKQATLEELHLAIQDACGWQNYHYFVFRDDRSYVGRELAGIPQEDRYGENRPPTPHPAVVKVADCFACTQPQPIYYEYDFGDSWLHEVKLTRCVELPEHFTRRLLAGERAFPPEDCGSTPGYEECLEALAHKENPDPDIGGYEREELERRLEWLGDWQPERFDLKVTKKSFDR